MGTVIHDQGRRTRQSTNRPNWLLIVCLMTARINSTNALLCSNILDDKYKEILKLQTPSNILYWLQKGLRQIPQMFKGRFSDVVLHIPQNSLPMTHSDGRKVEGLLKGLCDIYEGNPVINYI